MSNIVPGPGFGRDISGGLDGDGGGPHDPDMEQRVAKLETDVGEIKATLARLEPVLTRIDAGVRKLEADVGELKGRMTGIEGQLRQLPTMWTLTTLVLSIFGLAFVLLKFATPH
jgi:uncharacterized coiled-coil protein SlyX